MKRQITYLARNVVLPLHVVCLALVWAAAATGPAVYAAEAHHLATVSGVVRFEGAAPDRDVRDNEGRARPLLQVDKKERGLAYVVAFLKPLDGGIRSSEDMAEKAAEIVHIEQEDHEFIPRVVALRTGQKVAFGNSDIANHNVHSVARNPDNEFNVMTPYDNEYERIIHPEPNERPIRLGCDIHPWMTAWIYVFDHDLFGVSDEEGRFAIHNIPPGRYQLILQQPDGRLDAQTEITAEAGAGLDATATFSNENLAGQSPGKIEVSKAPTVR